MFQIQSKVLENQQISKDCFQLKFEYPQDITPPQAGQFLTIRVGQLISPLLRRPFAFSDYNKDQGFAEIIYERRGDASKILSSLKPGEALDILGPLGNFFLDPFPGSNPLLVAGGIGLGPLLFLYKHLKEKGFDPLFALGARSSQNIPKDLLPDDAILSTDDGSLAYKGTILEALQDRLKSTLLHKPVFYLCGPQKMMQFTGAWLNKRYLQAKTWVSMEQTMACAVGACMGCVVHVKHDKTYARVCSEGPIFDYNYLAWEGEISK